MTPAESAYGVSFSQLGIEVPSWASGPNVKVICPSCIHTHSIENRRRRDLSVNIIDGTYKCHRCDFQGSLRQEVREMDVQPIRSRSRAQRASIASTEAFPAVLLPSELKPWAIEWLASRAIPEDVAREFGIVSRDDAMYFPYYPKEFRQVPGAPRTLFNLNRCQQSDVIVITEGEMDVISCHMAGWKAVSPPDGAPGQIFEDGRPTGRVAAIGAKDAAFKEPEGYKALTDAKRIIIATDADLEGQALAKHLIEMFGPLKCWQVDWRKYRAKDANELLMRDGVKALDDALSSAKPVPLPGLRSLGHHREALYKLYEEGYAPGVSSGWPEFDHFYRPEPGKLLFVSGYSSRGKTSWLNHFFVNLARINDWRVALYSPEQAEEGEMLRKFVEIVNDAPLLPTAQKRMSREAMDMAIDWVDDHFYELHADDSSGGYNILSPTKILAQADPGVVKHGTNVVIVDPWNELESARPKGMTVEEYISTSISTFRAWSSRRNVLFIVVIHPRKPESAKNIDQAPHPLEAAGAMHWWSKADVFLTINRGYTGEDKGITTVKIEKHRKEGITGELGECKFRFDRATGRFRSADQIEAAPIGAHPYINLPDELRIIPRPIVQSEILIDGEAPW
jgi:twinkle protein